MNINENLILDCLNELSKNTQAKQKHKDYYEGNHSILKNYQMQDSRSNMKLVFNYPRKFVDNETGYILGKPINFISKSDDTTIIEAIDKNTSHWDKEHNNTYLHWKRRVGTSASENCIKLPQRC